ncbi:MAG TPA: trehalose-phosphatase [Mycobacteriales bacterium]|nr:trehalose-phosphatase [Mycobacteriales bacterium]
MLLPEPETAAGRAGLAGLLADPARALVAVDFDGTLAPIVERPDDARAAPGAVAALRSLADRVGTVAVVTGRPAEAAVDLGGLADVPRLLVLGHYGLERWHDGTLDTPEPYAAVAAARDRLADVLAGAPDGVHVEDKNHSLVVHTRPAADPAGALATLTPPLEALAAELGLEAVPGRLVLELRPPGVDKGAALRDVAVDRGARCIVYIGDDLGDLPAFAAVEGLRGGGATGLTVASVDPALDDAPRELAERADLVLAGPAAVVDFLAGLAGATGEP